jgi:hypothetical protein
MAVSFTVHHKDLNVKLDDKFHTAVDALFDRADKKNNGYITISLSLPRRHGTDPQNRAFHAMLTEIYISGLHSFKSYEDMRDYFKLKGAGAKDYTYIDIEQGRMTQHTVKLLDDVPRNCIWCKNPKSWIDFNRDERTKTIEYVKAYGFEIGMNSKKWDEIIQGMEENDR